MVAWLYHLVAILWLSIGCLSLGFGFGKSKSFIMEKRHSIESQEDIQQVLEHVFSASLLEQPRKVWENRMGFSGASVMEVDCNWESIHKFTGSADTLRVSINDFSANDSCYTRNCARSTRST